MGGSGRLEIRAARDERIQHMHGWLIHTSDVVPWEGHMEPVVLPGAPAAATEDANRH
jgi:hypothetical protein